MVIHPKEDLILTGVRAFEQWIISSNKAKWSEWLEEDKPRGGTIATLHTASSFPTWEAPKTTSTGIRIEGLCAHFKLCDSDRYVFLITNKWPFASQGYSNERSFTFSSSLNTFVLYEIWYKTDPQVKMQNAIISLINYILCVCLLLSSKTLDTHQHTWKTNIYGKMKWSFLNNVISFKSSTLKNQACGLALEWITLLLLKRWIILPVSWVVGVCKALWEGTVNAHLSLIYAWNAR